MKKLRILAVGDPAVYGYVKEEYKIISNYEKNNDIEIEFDIVEWEFYYNRLLESFLTYKYDIVMVAGHLWLTDFVNKGFLKELVVSNDSEYDYNDVLETIQNEMKLNDKQYLLPSFCDGHMLSYRSDKLQFKNREKISILETFPLLKKGDTCLKAHPSELFLDMLPYFRAYGVEPINDNGTCNCNDLNFKFALKHYKQMVERSVDNTLQFGNGEVLETIQSDTISCAVSWGGQIGQILNENCKNKDTLKFIGLEESWNVTWSFGIPKLSEKYDEALKFMKYLSSKEVDKLIGAYCGNPTRVSTFKEDADKYTWYPQLLNMLQTAKPLPNLPNTGELIGIYTEQFASYLNGDQTEEETIQNIKDKIA